jgi:hypothetical protein
LSKLERPRGGVEKVFMVDKCEADLALVRVGESDLVVLGEGVTEQT